MDATPSPSAVVSASFSDSVDWATVAGAFGVTGTSLWVLQLLLWVKNRFFRTRCSSEKDGLHVNIRLSLEDYDAIQANVDLKEQFQKLQAAVEAKRQQFHSVKISSSSPSVDSERATSETK
jgi:hypothetical protein